jgi:hypothetical protein
VSQLPNAQKLRIEVCFEKAAECRSLAGSARKQEHRIMLEHMAETWERIAADIEQWLIKT